jgi:CRISPR-associated protein Cas1
METIVLDDFGVFLGKTSERFVIKKKGKKVAEFPAREVERIIVASSGASMSSSALYLAVINRVPVAFTYASGRPFAFLTPTQGHGTVLTRRAQYTESESTRATHLAKWFIKGKMTNQRYLLKSWAKTRTRTAPDVAQRLFDLSDSVEAIANELDMVDGPLNSTIRLDLMNVEGRAASEYWRGVGLLIPSSYGFPGRRTRGASDPFNMMLNYGYGILYSEVWSAVTTAGLDPFAGFLHVDRPGRPSLVLDLIEEFRQQVVDRTVLRLTLRKSLRPEDIVENGELSRDTRQEIAAAVIDRLSDRVPVDNKKIPLKNVIVRQAWAVAKFVRRESERYNPFFLRW